MHCLDPRSSQHAMTTLIAALMYCVLVEAVKAAFDYFSQRGASSMVVPEWVPTPVNLQFTAAVTSLNRLVYGMISQRRLQLQQQPHPPTVSPTFLFRTETLRRTPHTLRLLCLASRFTLVCRHVLHYRCMIAWAAADFLSCELTKVPCDLRGCGSTRRKFCRLQILFR